MTNQLDKHHYRGFLARWYDRLLASETNDIEFYRKLAAETGGKILELACGTGRLLVPIRREGVDIEGLDVSHDMLELCCRKLDSETLTAVLHEQDMVDFDIHQQYSLIFISGGSFQLLEDTGDAMSALQKIHKHLLPGGQLVLDIFSPWDQIKMNREGQWTVRRTARNRDEELWCYECSYFDLPEQVQRIRTRYELYRKDRLFDTHCGEMSLRWYGKHEFTLMLGKAGFETIRVEAENIITRDGEALVYYAEKT